MRCAVPDCEQTYNSASSSGVSFHQFPAEASQRATWQAALGVSPPAGSVVCSRHFLADDLCADGRGLRPDAVPLQLEIKQEALNSTDKCHDLSLNNTGVDENTPALIQDIKVEINTSDNQSTLNSGVHDTKLDKDNSNTKTSCDDDNNYVRDIKLEKDRSYSDSSSDVTVKDSSNNSCDRVIDIKIEKDNSVAINSNENYVQVTRVVNDGSNNDKFCGDVILDVKVERENSNSENSYDDSVQDVMKDDSYNYTCVVVKEENNESDEHNSSDDEGTHNINRSCTNVSAAAAGAAASASHRAEPGLRRRRAADDILAGSPLEHKRRKPFTYEERPAG